MQTKTPTFTVVTFDSWLADEIAECERQMRATGGSISDSPPYIVGKTEYEYAQWTHYRKRANTLYDVLKASQRYR